MIKIELPKINPVITKVSKLDTVEYRQKCLSAYKGIILKFQNSPVTEVFSKNNYTEIHHIVPKCLGGTDDPSNLIRLPIRYHILSHILLAKAYPENNKLVLSLSLLVYGGNSFVQFHRQDILTSYFSLDTIAEMRIKAHEALVNRSDEELIKVREAGEKKLGKRLINRKFIETSSKLSDREVITTPEMSYERNKESHLKNPERVGTGRKHTDESRKKISISRHKRNTSESYIGGRNSQAKKVIGPDGQIFDCIQYAANFANVNRTTMRKWLNNKGKTSLGNHGYSFL